MEEKKKKKKKDFEMPHYERARRLFLLRQQHHDHNTSVYDDRIHSNDLTTIILKARAHAVSAARSSSNCRNLLTLSLNDIGIKSKIKSTSSRSNVEGKFIQIENRKKRKGKERKRVPRRERKRKSAIRRQRQKYLMEGISKSDNPWVSTLRIYDREKHVGTATCKASIKINGDNVAKKVEENTFTYPTLREEDSEDNIENKNEENAFIYPSPREEDDDDNENKNEENSVTHLSPYEEGVEDIKNKTSTSPNENESENKLWPRVLGVSRAHTGMAEAVRRQVMEEYKRRRR
eukprot:g4190.t1